MSEGKFGTAINCMDGRVQIPVIEWMKENYDLDFVDVITEPGPDAVMSSGNVMSVASIRSRIEISIGRHGSGVVAIVGHHDCAGNQVSREIHLDQIERSVQVIRGWGMPVEVVGLWVNEDWHVERLGEK